ncbi:DUF4190 domain-containing protein [Sinomonas sp. B1-1]|uniref:DUF4190 domain-containing protein n=1 Tax=Sinomonas sp. B1-1 TaxID=3141454 RepID=UPI003D2A694C
MGEWQGSAGAERAPSAAEVPAASGDVLFPRREPGGLAVASMVCGVLAVGGFGVFLAPQVAAIVLGHMALARGPGARGPAIAGLVLGYAALVLLIAGVAVAVYLWRAFADMGMT